jgi:hypothetical protein
VLIRLRVSSTVNNASQSTYGRRKESLVSGHSLATSFVGGLKDFEHVLIVSDDLLPTHGFSKPIKPLSFSIEGVVSACQARLLSLIDEWDSISDQRIDGCILDELSSGVRRPLAYHWIQDIMRVPWVVVVTDISQCTRTRHTRGRRLEGKDR